MMKKNSGKNKGIENSKKDSKEENANGIKEEDADKENVWTGNFYGLVGFICGVAGLIIYPIFFGIMAIGFGLMNMRNEEKNLWKLAIPLGVIDLVFVLFLIVYYGI